MSKAIQLPSTCSRQVAKVFYDVCFDIFTGIEDSVPEVPLFVLCTVKNTLVALVQDNLADLRSCFVDKLLHMRAEPVVALIGARWNAHSTWRRKTLKRTNDRSSSSVGASRSGPTFRARSMGLELIFIVIKNEQSVLILRLSDHPRKVPKLSGSCEN